MAIDQYAKHTTGPAVAPAEDLDVPEFLKDDYVPTKTATPAVPVTRPAPRTTQSAALVAAKATGRGLGHTARGIALAGRRWVEAYHDDYPHMITVAKAELRAAEDTKDAAAAKATVKQWRHDRRQHRLRHLGKTGVGTLVTSGGLAAGGLIVGGWVDLVVVAAGMGAAAWHGRNSDIKALEAAPAHEAIGGPAAPVGGETLLEAFAAIKVPDGARVVAHQPSTDGTSITVVNLPANFTVTSLRAKAEELAGALGRDTTMVDIQKAAHANQAAIWLSSTDPFEAARPSPLMHRHAPINTWTDGVPVAWGKRGNTVALPITNSNFLIAGMTRSGKGVGAANLAVGAAFDPWINLRLVAGKSNGEWDPAAKAGVASTYFKPDSARLLALLEVLLEDKDRREAKLGKLGKSKLVLKDVEKLGGIELLVIDELATYTRPGTPLRDEILAALIKLSSVAAGAGILMVLITQYPEADVVPQALAMNCGTRWAMRVDNATQSNAILGGAASSSGRDASKFDPPRPGLGWLVNPFAAVTDLARSFDLDEDERGEVAMLMARAARFRETAGRLVGKWEDPIERALAVRTGLSSAAGGPDRNGVPARVLHLLDPQQAAAYEALVDAVAVMDALGRDAQVEEMATKLGMPPERLSELLRAAGAGPTGKITVPDRGRVNGYRRDHLRALLDQAKSA
jgi:S-DNA-T family DNA segregation ATPase FtsK/SpoIIIE